MRHPSSPYLQRARAMLQAAQDALVEREPTQISRTAVAGAEALIASSGRGRDGGAAVPTCPGCDICTPALESDFIVGKYGGIGVDPAPVHAMARGTMGSPHENAMARAIDAAIEHNPSRTEAAIGDRVAYRRMIEAILTAYHGYEDAGR